jgi:hypothetical protein
MPGDFWYRPAPMVAPVRSNRPVAAVKATGAADASRVAGDFYNALSRRDAKGMASAYAPNLTFHDLLFGTRKGKKQQADGSYDVKVHWDAHDDLGPRHVDNHADSTLTIENGKIVAQRDARDLDAWTKQALPLGGGTKVGDALAAFAAHTLLELKDSFSR